MVGAGNAVGEHAGERHIGPIGGEAVRERAEGLRHGAGIHHRQYRHAESARQIGARRLAIEQPHHTFDQDEIGLARGVVKQLPARRFTHHPEIELVYRIPRGTFEDHGIEKIRPGLEHAHVPPLLAVKARERRRDRGLALAGGGRGDQQRGAATGHQSSTPFCARMPARKACLTSITSDTVSAMAIKVPVSPSGR